VLHFAGHGQFVTTATSESNIKLEDGALSASEVARPEVRLGKACRTLVFFNACEVGAAGTIFGEVGGWAAAFLSRQFGGFIAPLWSVEDEDASVVASELLRGILTERRPVGEVMRLLRTKYGDASPTFYSYLYYGDVTARVSP
jgi:CHAT domain-containing protein